MSQYPNKAHQDQEQEQQFERYVSVGTLMPSLVASMERRGYTMVAAPSGVRAGYDVYKKRILDFHGLTNTTAMRKLETEEENMAFNLDLKSVMDLMLENCGGSKSEIKACIDIIEAFTLTPNDPRTKVYGYSVSLHNKEQRTRSISGQDAYAQIPNVSWFTPELQKLDPKELLAIMPEAEAEMLMLVLGRTVLGTREANILEGKMEHRARTALVLYGKDGGGGKSTLLDLVSDGLHYCGFHTEGMIPPGAEGARFGAARYMTADLAIVDDLVSHLQVKMLKDYNIKTVITGGALQTEEKGARSVRVTAQNTVICCTNFYSKHQFLDVDHGSRSRFKFLYTYTEEEVLEMEAKTGRQVATTGRWRELCKKYKCTNLDLACYLLARSAEMFIDACDYEVKHSQLLEKDDYDYKKLKKVTEALSKKLVKTTEVEFLDDLVASTKHLVALAIATRNPSTDLEVSEYLEKVSRADFSTQLLSASVQAFVSTSGKGNAPYLPKLSYDCYIGLKRAPDLYNGDNNSDTNLSFKRLTAALQADSHCFPQRAAYYKEPWEQAKRTMANLVTFYSNPDNRDKALVSKLSKATQLIREYLTQEDA